MNMTEYEDKIQEIRRLKDKIHLFKIMVKTGEKDLNLDDLCVDRQVTYTYGVSKYQEELISLYENLLGMGYQDD